MLSYQTLDRIADSYTPCLALLWLLVSLQPLLTRRWALAGLRLGVGVLALLLAYAGMGLDNALRLWPRMGWDYSTHTAVSLALAWMLALFCSRLRAPVLASLLGYGALMLYQRYHTPQDLLSTALALALPLALLGVVYRRSIDALSPIRAVAVDPG